MAKRTSKLRARPQFRLKACVAAILTIGISCDTFAAIATDASLGLPAQALVGPSFVIPQTLGKLSGNNLFHSFQTFDILAGESANFTTTTAGLANVISRVTGGALSQINGPLSLTPCAGCGAPNFFFINPAGVLFGAGASINVPGAFHVSTADYVKFADGNFYANPALASTFSVAPPSAFGFLGTTRAPIAVNGGATLSTQTLQPISIVAGDVTLDNGTASTLNGGDIRIAALGQTVQETPFTGPLLAANGNISILNGGQISSSTFSAGNAGSIKVNAGSIAIDGQNSGIFSEASMSWSAPRGNGGTVDVTAAGNLSIMNGGRVSSRTITAGNAGSVKVNAGSIAIDGQNSGIFSEASMLAGDGGTVDVTAAGSLSIRNGGQISSSTYLAGNAGSVKANAGSIAIDGQSSGILSNANWGNSNAGTVDVTAAGNLSIRNGGQISSSTSSSGNAGSVKVNAGSIAIDGQNSGVFSDTDVGWGGCCGNAGTMDVTAAGNLSIMNGGKISSSTYSAGNAGSVRVNAGVLLVDGAMSGISASAMLGSSGQTGDVIVNATDSITLSNGGELAIRNDATVFDPNPFVVSLITQRISRLVSVTAPRITIINSPNAITTASTGNVAAGSININASDKLYLDPSGITTTSNMGNGGAINIQAGLLWLNNSQIATSVTGFAGNGGNITIGANTLILDTGFIQANTAAANAIGGTVTIGVQNLIASGNTLFLGGSTPYTYTPGVFGFNVIQAAAPTGVSGAVQNTTPVLDISGSLGALYAQVVSTGGLSRSPCQSTGGSSLAQSGRGGLPPSASGLLRADPVMFSGNNGLQATSGGGYMQLASTSGVCS